MIIFHQGKTYERAEDFPVGTENVQVWESGVLIESYLLFPDGSRSDFQARAEAQDNSPQVQASP